MKLYSGLEKQFKISEIRSTSYDNTFSGAVLLTMLESKKREPVTKDAIRDASWSIDIAGKVFPCKVRLKPLYNQRMKI